MTIEELEDKHYSIFEDRGIGNPDIKHAKLSIQFAISVLEDVDNDISNISITESEYCIVRDVIKSKIQELKQCLDGN